MPLYPAPVFVSDDTEARTFTFKIVAGHYENTGYEDPFPSYDTRGLTVGIEMWVPGCCGPSTFSPTTATLGTTDGDETFFEVQNVIANSEYDITYTSLSGDSDSLFHVQDADPSPIPEPDVFLLPLELIYSTAGTCFPHVVWLTPPYDALYETGACDFYLQVRHIVGYPDDPMPQDWGIYERDPFDSVELEPPPDQVLAYPLQYYMVLDPELGPVAQYLEPGEWYEFRWAFRDGDVGTHPTYGGTPTSFYGEAITFQSPYVTGGVKLLQLDYDQLNEMYTARYQFEMTHGDGTAQVVSWDTPGDVGSHI